MLAKVKITVKRFGMLDKGDTVLVAVSGGIDSVVLLHALAGLAKEYKLLLIAAHLNHGLRGKESDRDEAFVRELAKKLKINFVGKKVDVKSFLKKGDSLQDGARKIRYGFFEETAKKYKAQKIATGHNLDDQAETVLMRFLKGAGLKGLSGIPPVRDNYIRPLIEASRKEIEDDAEGSGLKFVKDSSNKSAKYLRNRIRLKLMPILKEYNPSIKKELARLSRILERDEGYLKSKAGDAYKSIVMRRDKDAVSLYLKKLNRLHDAIKARVFFMAVEELLGSSKGFYSCHVEDFLRLLCNDAPNLSINLPRNLTAYKEYDIVAIEKRERRENRRRGKKQEIFFEKILKINGKTNVIADNGFKIAEFKSEIHNHNPAFRIPHHAPQNAAYFDYDKLKFPFLVRNFRPGDRFAPLGMNGRKKVKDLFQEKKVARRRRALIPIVVSGDKIIWVAGIRQAECGKMDSNTKRILKVVLK